MTAIFGLANYAGDARNRLLAMAGALAHRGAADPKYYEAESAALGIREFQWRHAKENAGISSWDGGDVQAVIDGKIVNGASLRERLATDTRPGPAAGPAELVVQLYKSRGVSCFELLRGSFAIALHDQRNDRLILARDHLGHKPVFFADTEEGFFFASETKGLLAAHVVPFRVDMEALSHFLSLRFVPAPHSLVKGIVKLPPAHIAIHRQGKTTLRRYWQLSFAEKMRASLDDAIDGLEERLQGVVGDYLHDSGVAGAFLSGGLDSGLIVANMSRLSGNSFGTYSLGVENSSDEVPIARLVAARYGTKQHEFYPRDDIVRLLPAMIWSLDEPSDMVLVSKFLLARMAFPHLDTVMSGDGGDELFAGFMRYMGIRDARYYGLVPGWLRNRLVSPLTHRFGGRKSLKGIAGKLLWLTEVTAAGELPERYAEAVEYLRFRKADKQALLTEEAWNQLSSVESSQLLAQIVRESDAQDPIEKLLHTDFLTRLPEHLLMLDDRTGAAHGINVLCPLADKNMVEYAAAIPIHMKMRGRQGKFIERKLAERMLPMEAVKFQKTGWSFPFAELCAGPLQPFLRRVFADSRLVGDGYFRQAFLDRIIAEHGTGKVDHHIRIWMLLSLEIWYRMLADNLHHEDMIPWMDSHLAN